MKKLNLSELWLGIKDIKVDNLLIDFLAESLWYYLGRNNIRAEKLPINREYLGECYLPWYKSGNWAFGGQYRVKEFPNKIKLGNGRHIITVVDNLHGKRVIVDGSHRAVALYQARPQNVDGFIIVLKTEKAGYLFPKDVYWNSQGGRYT